MRAKANKKIVFVCSDCGGEHLKWAGRCSYCGAWNTLREIEQVADLGGGKSEKAEPLKLSEIKSHGTPRFSSGLEEFDLVSGGGLVAGSVTLLGGQPGIGKSTLVWQVSARLAGPVVYVAAEESPEQLKIRAARLGGKTDGLIIFDNPDVTSWLFELEKIKPALLIVDSIQTVFDPGLPGSSGSIIQVKETALKIIRVAKKLNLATILIGHVTKEGEVAGPKMLEHLVDAVFYLDGERGQSERFLRAQKNRFGPTDEMGVFRLTEKGFVSAADFGRLSPENKLPLGVTRTAVVEGSRVYFVEVQALVTKSAYNFPRRNCVGYDFNRLEMLLAILNQRTKVNLSGYDVFINIASGYKLKDPVGDLAVISALASAYTKKSISGKLLSLGEVDLAGRIHLPESAKKIIKAAQKLGYRVPVDKNTEIPFFLSDIFRAA